MATGLEHPPEPDWRVETGRDERAHAAFADCDDRVAHGANVGAAVEHRGVESVLGRNQRRQLPIGEMRGKDQRRLAVGAQLLEPVIGLRRVEDVSLLLRVGIEDLQAVDMGELRRDAAEIVPNVAQYIVDVGGGFFREGGYEVGTADAVLLEPGAERAHDAAGQIGHMLSVGRPEHAQRPDGQPSERRVGGRLGISAGSMGEASRRGHQSRSRRFVKR